MKLGTYTTFDCPTEQQNKAFKFLQKEFKKIEGYVKKTLNPHDFGAYPSFEIDYPIELKDIDDNEIYESDKDQRLSDLKDEWHNKANEIQEKYNKKFGKYL